MDRTKWIIFAAVCVAIIGFLIYSRQSSTPAFEGDPAKVVEGDNAYGNKGSKVVFIEYGDFQCPGCASLYPHLKEVKEEYKDQVAFVFRHMPLTNIHPNAKAAAVAAQAVAVQNDFWKMHDLLFENQDEWKDAQADSRSQIFEKYANQVVLDINKYKEDVASKAVTERVNRDLEIAKKGNVEFSTPSLVLNGKQVKLSEVQTDGTFDSDKIRQLLNNALQEAGIELPKQEKPKE